MPKGLSFLGLLCPKYLIHKRPISSDCNFSNEIERKVSRDFEWDLTNFSFDVATTESTFPISRLSKNLQWRKLAWEWWIARWRHLKKKIGSFHKRKPPWPIDHRFSSADWRTPKKNSFKIRHADVWNFLFFFCTCGSFFLFETKLIRHGSRKSDWRSRMILRSDTNRGIPLLISPSPSLLLGK